MSINILQKKKKITVPGLTISKNKTAYEHDFCKLRGQPKKVPIGYIHEILVKPMKNIAQER